MTEAVERFKASEHFYKEKPGRRIFQTQNDFGELRSPLVVPIFCDFDAAEDDDYYAQIIQPNPYRAPEVIMGWGWTNKVDIWNFGHVVRLVSVSSRSHTDSGDRSGLLPLDQTSSNPCIVRMVPMMQRSIWRR